MDIHQASSSTMNFHTKVRIIYASVGVLIGISIFIVFGFNYHNWDAATWGLTSGVVACLTLIVHLRYSRKLAMGRHIEPTLLSRWMLLGCFIQLAGVCGFTVYLTLAITQGQGLQIYGAGYYLTLVWCFMTWKWGFILLLSARRYRNMLYEVYTILPKSEKS
ncbi:heme transporter hrg1-A-like [Mizuhopecten yessoensis]|uniref:Heme transporter hrg1-A n=1 Tax=Mizuhopecten yessoensis TaxID=6573 RepID=A0A210PSW3_MIZYE|nr:heme transporter hrg1-A-like [Mizuhopecten yessoensis]OWF39587.1 Heme transporter hrg1-A [Mizuhopecten yessoensis]